MKCPHCFYEHTWDWEENRTPKHTGESGDFFTFTKVLKRQEYGTKFGWATERAQLYGCPVCTKTFIA